MEEVFYKKVGRRYVPVSYYDTDVMDSIPYGSHLIIKAEDGVTSRRQQVIPAFAPMLAAAYHAEKAIVRAIMKASELRPTNKSPLTPEQAAAWSALSKTFGTDMYPLTYGSYQDAADAGAKAMAEEAEKLLQHPSVRAAYEHFLLTCELTNVETR